MARTILLRITSTLPTLWVVVTVVFLAIRVVPGDPALVILGDHASAEALENLRKNLGLNEPLLKQYVGFLAQMLRLDFGRSIVSNAPILPQIMQVVPYSVELAIAGMLIGFIIGLPLGIVSAVRQNTWVDYVGRIASLAGISSPAFFLGIVLLIIFAVELQWFPVISASETQLQDLGVRLHNLTLPALTLGLIESAFIMRFSRAALLEVLHRQYIATARSKGLSERIVLAKHALRNALIPIITIVGLNLGGLMGGAILTETVFNRPGLGKLLLGAILQRDYNLLQAAVVIFASFVIIVNLLIDILYIFIDPRIRYE